jgi:hypothetical protein
MERSRAEKSVSSQFVVALVAIAVFATLSVLAAIYSQGFLTGDACTHYLYARYALQNPVYLVDVWGRPMVTAIDMLPAILAGRIGVRVTSLAMAIGCALLAWRWAAEQGMRRPVLALLFTLGQPWLFLHSFGEMTELPFAFFLGLTFWAYARRRWLAMACLAALLPLGRPEGFIFLAAAAIVLMREGGRRWAYLLILALPLIAWDVAGWELGGRSGPWWRWLAQTWPWSEQSSYGHGSLLAFVGQLPVIAGPFVLPATIVGMVVYLRSRSTDAEQWRMRRVTALIPLAVLVGHSILYWLGKMASYGEARYLLITAPFWGVLSAAGWEWVFVKMRWHRPIAWAALAAMSPVLFNFIDPVVPVKADADWLGARRFADWYRSDRAVEERYPRLIATHTAVFYYLDIDPNDPNRTAPKSPKTFAHPPPGTMLVWDPRYGAHNADNRLVIDPAELTKWGWKELPAAESAINDSVPMKQRWRVFGR